jgi:ubiquinone/menaquinone biosynthesis C-methylase UbiE
MSVLQLSTALGQPSGLISRLASYLISGQQQQLSHWTVEQLNIQPYQHLLEVGYGSGNTLQEVARRLKVGFLAGIDDSISLYRQAYRKNLRAIKEQLMQLHFGGLHELPYPPHYFHTIYGSNVHFRWEDPQREFIRLANLLKSGGRLVMVFQSPGAGKIKDTRDAVEKIEEDYLAAGLTDIRIRYLDGGPGACVAASAYKM